MPETYVHRIGRTGRAGLGGVAISFCDFDEKERLADIEKLIGKHLIEIENHPFPLINNFPAVKNTQTRNRTAQKKSFVQRGSKQKATTTKETSPDKKYRMTADGKLKEKRSLSNKPKDGKRKIGYFKKSKD
jgi:ATP-dependent RNA helicase RhlE